MEKNKEKKLKKTAFYLDKEKANIQIFVDKEVKAKLYYIAQSRNIRVSDLINEVLKKEIKNLK